MVEIIFPFMVIYTNIISGLFSIFSIGRDLTEEFLNGTKNFIKN